MTRRASFWSRLFSAFRSETPPPPAVFGFRLPSNLDGAYFRIEFAVLPHPSAQMRDRVRGVAAREAGSTSALEADMLEGRLRLALVDAGLGFTHLRVRIFAEEQGMRLAEQYEQLARDRVLGEERAKDVVQGLRYFRTHVLDQGLLGLWWLNAERDRLQHLGQSSEQIAGAIALLQSGRSGQEDDRLVSLWHRFLESTDSSDRQRLVPHLIKLFQIWDRPDLVQELTGALEPSPTWAANGDGHVSQSSVLGVGRPSR